LSTSAGAHTHIPQTYIVEAAVEVGIHGAPHDAGHIQVDIKNRFSIDPITAAGSQVVEGLGDEGL
jgi:hypothetical protein